MKKTSITNYIYYFSLFVYFYTSYNITVSGYFLNKIYLFGALIASLILLLFFNKDNKIKKYNIFFSITIMLVAMIMMFRNSNVVSISYFLIGLFFAFALQFTNKWVNKIIPIMKIFAVEHIFFTFFCYIFRDFYKINILPIFSNSSGYRDLLNQYNQNLIAGMTGNYGSNGIYLSISLIVFVAILLNKKNRKLKDFIPTIICTLAILITGKRASLIFSFITLTFMYFISNRKKVNHKIVKYFIGILVAFMSFILVAQFVPQLSVTMNRFLNGVDISNGRFELYDLALRLFKDNPIIGIGWGNYKYHYALNIYNEYHQMLDVHNNYLQFLCETGIIGFTFLVGILMTILLKTRKMINSGNRTKYSDVLLISYGIQIYILFYSFTGNPFYLVESFYPYLIACLIPFVIYLHDTGGKNEKNGK